MSRIFEFLRERWKHVAMATGYSFSSQVHVSGGFFRTPSLGYANGFLAVVAAVMAALMENLGAMARFAWIILLFGFLWIETRAIDDDNKKNERAYRTFWFISGRRNRTEISWMLRTRIFRDVLSIQERNSSATLRQLLNQPERTETRVQCEFSPKQQQLFEHEDNSRNLSNGRLVPASELHLKHLSGAQGDSVLLSWARC